MKNATKYFALSILTLALVSCSSDDNQAVANKVTLEFTNTFGDKPLVLGDANSTTATVNTSVEGQVHHFSEVKYVISNIRLVKNDGKEIPYHINDLDQGATVINQAKSSSLSYVLREIPKGEYKQIKFGLGVRSDLNVLNEAKFPAFYAAAGANDTEMMWEWGTGYRFTKIEGFYEADHKTLSIHTGSTVDDDDTGALIQGVDAYRDVTLDLPVLAQVGKSSPVLVIKADFNALLSGKSNTITLTSGTGSDDNATPNVHTAVQMTKFVDNLGGNGTSDLSGMFSILEVKN
ncbi:MULTISPECIES: MbnP family protein [unclassified Myroides]|uniref:MbnP family protein n=1 Tax=unclassified Myroides TaxID=2642485 RepID=UPI003D2F9ABA